MTRRIVSRIGLVVVAVALFLQIRQVAAHTEPGDFGAYWAAARLATTNPYSHDDVLRFERSIGDKSPTPLLMRNPPWTLPLVYPLRWFSYPTGYALWTMAGIAVICGATLALWLFYGGKPSLGSLLLPMTFAPALSLLNLGQLISSLPLLGFCLFLLNIERRRDWLAGASLFFVLLKPHLFPPFFACLVLWVIWTRRYRVLAAAGLALAVASALAVAINWRIFALYREAVADLSANTGKPPTLGMNLHWVTGSLAIAMLPTIAAVGWCVWRWWDRRECWQWKNQLAPVLLLSLVSGYYVLLYDEVALLAALVPVAIAGGRRFWISFALVSAACVLYLMGRLDHLPGARAMELLLSFWSAAGWCLVYLTGRMHMKRQVAVAAAIAGTAAR